MMGQAQDKAQHLADEAQQQFGNMTDQAQQQFSQLADQAQYQATQLQSQFTSTMQQNPLAVGAIAFGLGLAAGLAVPETRQEDQLFGSTSDQLTNKAQQAASDKVEQFVGQMSSSGSSQSTHAAQSS